MARYVVKSFDCAGEHVASQVISQFERCKRVACAMAARYPNDVILAFNMEQNDANFDGLTDEERDAIAVAVASGRRAAVEGRQS